MLEARLAHAASATLISYYASELGCDATLFGRGGIHVVTSPRRARPGWGGYTVPALAISSPKGGIMSVRADLHERIARQFSFERETTPMGGEDFEQLRRMVYTAIPYAHSLNGHAMSIDVGAFRPIESQAVLLDSRDTRGIDLRRRFDGPVYVVFGIRGQIVSWAAIKLKSDTVWEIAVVTESGYRGRGLAKQVVSAATRRILDEGKTPLYVYDRTNFASGRVCRSLGYEQFAEQFFSEY
jgi:GNAT superfamily N-acetyltransferase